MNSTILKAWGGAQCALYRTYNIHISVLVRVYIVHHTANRTMSCLFQFLGQKSVQLMTTLEHLPFYSITVIFCAVYQLRTVSILILINFDTCSINFWQNTSVKS